MYPDWILHPPSTPKTARMLLCRVWDLQQATGWCFADQDTLAIDLGVNVRTIERSVSLLAQRGYLEIRRKTVRGRKRVNHMRTTSVDYVQQVTLTAHTAPPPWGADKPIFVADPLDVGPEAAPPGVTFEHLFVGEEQC